MSDLQMMLISTHPIKKSDLGFHGNLFGGKLLAWIDAAGSALAQEAADTPRMVTVGVKMVMKYTLIQLYKKYNE